MESLLLDILLLVKDLGQSSIPLVTEIIMKLTLQILIYNNLEVTLEVMKEYMKFTTNAEKIL